MLAATLPSNKPRGQQLWLGFGFLWALKFFAEELPETSHCQILQ
jgi:hypothetical protein